jgi:hypothetical protein
MAIVDRTFLNTHPGQSIDDTSTREIADDIPTYPTLVILRVEGIVGSSHHDDDDDGIVIYQWVVQLLPRECANNNFKQWIVLYEAVLSLELGSLPLPLRGLRWILVLVLLLRLRACSHTLRHVRISYHPKIGTSMEGRKENY